MTRYFTDYAWLGGDQVSDRVLIEVDGYRVISGVEEKTGKRFKLRVGEHRVRGTIGSQQVSFALRDVKPLTRPATTLAAR